MSKTDKKRALALFLCAALTVSQMGITAFAEEAVPPGTGTQQEHPQEAAAQSGTDESTGDYGKVKTATDSDAAREHTQHWDNGKNAAQSLDHGGSVSTPSNAGRPEKEPVDEDGTVIAFTPLDKKIQKQETEAGTALEDLTLPDSLEVSLYSEDEAVSSDSVTVGKLEVLKWNSTPDYTGEPGTYVFTPKLAEGYPLRDGVKAPEITVTVKGAVSNSLEQKILHWSWAGDNATNLSGGEETGSWEMNLPGVSEKNQASFDNVVSLLPDKIAETTEQTATDSSTEGKTELTLSGWSCKQFHQDDSNQWPIQGKYIFTASLPEGYVLAPDAKPLEVKVVLGGANLLEANTHTAGDFTLTGQSTDYSYDSNTQILTIVDGAELTIQNTKPDTPTTDKIVVANGAKADITLDGVNIDVSRIFWANALDVTGATVTLNLEGENTLISGHSRAGVLVPENSALTINGTGKLTVRGGQVKNYGGAGIGANNGGTCGSITIKGGKVDTMAVGAGGAGIGLGGWGGSGGSISISGGRVISAGGGEGSFTVSDAANIKITGGIVETPKDTKLSDEANVTKENCIIFENHNGQVYGTFALTADYTVPAGDTLALFPGTALHIDQNAVLTINGILLNQGTVTGTLGGIGRVASDDTISPDIPPSLSPLQQGSGVIDVNEGKAVLYTNWYFVGDQLYGYDASKVITLTGTTNTNTVTVQSGSKVDVKLDNVDIENTNGGACSFALLGNATCHLTLADDSTNILKSDGGQVCR